MTSSLKKTAIALATVLGTAFVAGCQTTDTANLNTRSTATLKDWREYCDQRPRGSLRGEWLVCCPLDSYRHLPDHTTLSQLLQQRNTRTVCCPTDGRAVNRQALPEKVRPFLQLLQTGGCQQGGGEGHSPSAPGAGNPGGGNPGGGNPGGGNPGGGNPGGGNPGGGNPGSNDSTGPGDAGPGGGAGSGGNTGGGNTGGSNDPGDSRGGGPGMGPGGAGDLGSRAALTAPRPALA